MIVNCPHCGMQMEDDGQLAGQLVMCPQCRGQMVMPNLNGQFNPSPMSPYNPAATTAQPYITPPPASDASPTIEVRGFTSGSRQRSRPRQTDIFAVICFASGILSIFLLPIFLVPVCYIAGMISYFRLRENPNLKGQGMRIVGCLCGAISFLYLMWLFEFGFFAPK